MFKAFVSTLILATAFIAISTASPATAEETLPPNECLICEFDLTNYSGPLSSNEIQGLLLALNDEYHAWATYDQVLERFGAVAPFINIRGSEAHHIELLTTLFERYGVVMPENPWIGNAPGFDSVAEACQAGVNAEIVNRDLYDRLYGTTDREDILAVYHALQWASDQRHLPAFARCGSGPRQGR